jgi:hypothetical protein
VCAIEELVVRNDLDDRPLAGRGSAAQPGVVNPADQRSQHHRRGPQGLQDLFPPVNIARGP